MEIIQNIDAFLFHFINRTLANSVTDRLMPFITERNNWFIFYVLIWLYLMLKGGRKGKVAGILVLILILITDQFANNVLKMYFQRIRPCHVLTDVNILINCSESYSFPSNHAVNNFAAAYFFSYFYPDVKYFLYSGAAVISISRVMCGVHYPFDILAGAVVGILFAMLIIYLWKLFNGKFHILIPSETKT
ncbi:MAG: phosphatase PAP2 family protein [Bacteroidetes bacterium]|nr:phosphatase PAP2 family protein [Bacteroidota bacterium]